MSRYGADLTFLRPFFTFRQLDAAGRARYSRDAVLRGWSPPVAPAPLPSDGPLHAHARVGRGTGTVVGRRAGRTTPPPGGFTDYSWDTLSTFCFPGGTGDAGWGPHNQTAFTPAQIALYTKFDFIMIAMLNQTAKQLPCPGTATLTSFWTMFRAFLSFTPPPPAPCTMLYVVPMLVVC